MPQRRTMHTDYLPAERATDEDLARGVAIVERGVPAEVLHAVPVGVIILNDKRQIVFCNGAFRGSAETAGTRDVVGKRPGEALGCLHAHANEGGCGTSVFCRHCGAALAILKSLRGEDAVEDCRLVRAGAVGDESMDMQIFTKPMELEGEPFIMVTALDVSHEKRRDALERIFFHDVMSGASGILLYSELMERGNVGDCAEAGNVVRRAAGKLVEAVQAQKDLVAAESGRLGVLARDVDALDLLRAVRDDMAERGEARGRVLALSPDAEPAPLSTDPRLARRVVAALAANALEAVADGEVVTLSCRARRGGAEILVHNPGVLSESVRRQLFKRSFSTKGKGRGLGLYMARLVGEGYLGGSLSFESGEGQGTVFTLALPPRVDADI